MTNTKERKLIKLFREVQGIPYFLLRHRDSSKLFRLKKGCCAEKAIWLGNKLREMNIPVKYFLIRFRWEDLPIPKIIMKLKKRGAGYHLSLKAKVNNKWIWIDPTWDPKLEKGGFPITKNWDGKTNTKLAVKPQKIKEFIPEDPSDTGLDYEFTKAFNQYLGKIRKDNYRK